MLQRNKRYRVVLFGTGEKPVFGGISEGMPQPYGNGYRFIDPTKGDIEIIVSGNVVIREETEEKEKKG